MRSQWFIAIMAVIMFTSNAQASKLMIDFNSTSQDGGPHNQGGYEAYDAGHEVPGDFNTKSYSALGTTVTVTPAWPNTTDNRVQQMIDRGAGNDANWDDAAGDLDLITDFLGIDARTGNGGNGNWDGTTGTPTYMTLSIGGLRAADYIWKSFHHDTENVHVEFRVEVSTDGGATFGQLADGVMTDSSPGGNPDSATDGSVGIQVGPDANSLVSTYSTIFTANGSDDVIFRFAPYANTAVHSQIWGINGFEITAVPEPSTILLALMGGLMVIGLVRRRVD